MEKEIRKIKLIYSGELIVIAIVFLTLGILEMLHVMTLYDRFQLIFKIITLVGVAWIIFDFFWTLLSEKKRKKNSLLDKILLLPVAIYLLAFDIYGFISPRPYEYYQIGVPLAFYYIACVYLFEGFYHYYHPIPMVQEMIEEAIKSKEAEKMVKESNEAYLEEKNEEQQSNEDNEKGAE